MARYIGRIKLDTPRYKLLEPVFRELLLEFFYYTNQLDVKKENFGRYCIDDGNLRVKVNSIIEQNMRDIRRDSKPPGYNPDEGTRRLIFPITEKVEFYVTTTENAMTHLVTEEISKILTRSKIKHDIAWETINEKQIKTATAARRGRPHAAGWPRGPAQPRQGQ